MKACKTACALLAAAVVVGAAAGWAIFLAGVASLHSSCNRDELPVPDRVQLFTVSGIPGHPSCAWQQGWQWLVVFGQLAWLIAAALALFVTAARGLGLASLALLALWTSFVMPLCNSYLALHYNLVDAGVHGSGWMVARGAECAVAGTLISSIANLLLLVILGCRCQAGDAKPACCKAKPACPPTTGAVSLEARAGPDAANTDAFIRKTEQAAATGANMV